MRARGGAEPRCRQLPSHAAMSSYDTAIRGERAVIKSAALRGPHAQRRCKGMGPCSNPTGPCAAAKDAASPPPTTVAQTITQWSQSLRVSRIFLTLVHPFVPSVRRSSGTGPGVIRAPLCPQAALQIPAIPSPAEAGSVLCCFAPQKCKRKVEIRKYCLQLPKVVVVCQASLPGPGLSMRVSRS